jgi:hypothetical protein
LTLAAWIINCGAATAIISNIIIGLLLFNYDNYVPKGWHTTLFMWGLIATLFLLNLYFKQLLNVFELVGGICHVIFFISSIITLVVLARRSSPEFVFNTSITSAGGWTNPGVSWGIGLLTLVFAISGM